MSLQRNAQVIPSGHDDHTNQQPNLSENATLRPPKICIYVIIILKKLKAQMRHAATHARSMHVHSSAAKCQQRSGGSHAANCLWTNALCAHQHGRCGEVGRTCHLYEPLDVIWKILSDDLPPLKFEGKRPSAQSQLFASS